MSIIHVLDKEIAQLIAAGEVVERPASAIKELVENSIDAGATLITVEIRHGGVTYMRVSDNGCGIAPDDVEKVFLRHATSKVRKEEDLNQIATLGFRGEAMASIHAVCRIEMRTCVQGAMEGILYTAQGGENVEISQIGCPVGTTVIARDIFFNTPARMKFLKKDVAESSSVTGIIEKAALSHPEISFKLIRDGQLRLHTPGDGKLLSAIMAVYGREFSHGVVPVDYKSEDGKIQISGYVTIPTASRSNRTWQNYFINGRYVKSRTAAAALEEAYKHSIMVGKFPACVLNIQLPFDETDVNVHPSKIEVRFTNEKPVFDAVYYGVKNALQQHDYSMNLSQQTKQKKLSILDLELQEETEQLPLIPKSETEKAPAPKAQKPPIGEHVTVKEYQQLVGKAEPGERKKQPAERLILSDNAPTMAGQRERFSIHIPKESRAEKASLKTEEPKIRETFSEQPAQKLPVSSESSIQQNSQSQKEESLPEIEETVKIIGEIFGTYIILQNGKNMILIDKHAAHERLLFNQLKEQALSEDRQVLLEPMMVHLSREDYQGILGRTEEYRKVGFLVEDFGDGDVMVREVPTILNHGDIQQIIEEIAHNLSQDKKDLTPVAIDDLLHSVACKSAIRANDKTSHLEMEQLVTLLRDNEDVKYCPHGRPIARIMSQRDIEKMFGRIQ